MYAVLVCEFEDDVLAVLQQVSRLRLRTLSVELLFVLSKNLREVDRTCWEFREVHHVKLSVDAHLDVQG